ncbi:MAG TPA: hydrogenase maturation protease [Pirellulales bacterium]|nr:hydrogenase maturation protease [Pirellulales bacterium]
MMATTAPQQKLSKAAQTPTLVVGLGSAHGDDRLGWLVAQHLGASITDDATTIRVARSPADLFVWLDGIESLMICDACENLGSPGAIHCWRWPDVPRGALRAAGTHDLGLGAVLELAEHLHLLPAETLIWCVETETPQPGAPISAAIEVEAIRAAQMILSTQWAAKLQSTG